MNNKWPDDPPISVFEAIIFVIAMSALGFLFAMSALGFLLGIILNP